MNGTKKRTYGSVREAWEALNPKKRWEESYALDTAAQQAFVESNKEWVDAMSTKVLGTPRPKPTREKAKTRKRHKKTWCMSQMTDFLKETKNRIEEIDKAELDLKTKNRESYDTLMDMMDVKIARQVIHKMYRVMYEEE